MGSVAVSPARARWIGGWVPAVVLLTVAACGGADVSGGPATVAETPSATDTATPADTTVTPADTTVVTEEEEEPEPAGRPARPPRPPREDGPPDSDGPAAPPSDQPAGADTTPPITSDTLEVEAADRPDTYWVRNLTSRARLYVEIVHPEGWDGETLPALVLVPGGSSAGGPAFLGPRPIAATIAAGGYTVVVFDPDGRGKSEGNEDYNGFQQQDGLAAVIQFTATLPEADAARIGVVSYSYGITMASGALARHPDLPVRFLIDWEGPATRDDTGGCDGAGLGHLQDLAACDDESFWQEREALTFIAGLPLPYQRLQSEKDHVQPDVLHALRMVNAAVEGGAPWVRLNLDAPNQTYGLDAPPAMLPDADLDRGVETFVLRMAEELLALPGA